VNASSVGNSYRALVVKPEGQGPLGKLKVSRRIILRRIFRKWDGA
jgi:hypothetical protein